MNTTRLDRIQADLQRARTVVYLEGKTDEELLFALAGVTRPSSGIYRDVYVVGLKTKGGGGNEVSALVEAAVAAGLAGQPGGGGVFGLLDGDGRERSELLRSPRAPLCFWPTYCIENLLAVTWPPAWGATPDWTTVLNAYVPYAALNRVHVQLQSALRTLQLEKFHSPASGPLKTVEDVKVALATDKNLIAECDVEARFEHEVAHLETALSASVAEGHALINGKWLLSHYAKERQPGRSVEALRGEWARQVLAAGGHPEVREIWAHLTGEAP